jgi:putative tricarboxylic transport membrane protein
MTQNSGRRPDGAAFVISAVLAGFGLLLIWEASRIPEKAGYSGVGPGEIPALVGWGLLLLAGWTALAAWRGEFEPRPRQKVGPLAWVLGGLVLQLVLLHPAGFSIASGLLFACTAAAFGKRNLLLTIPVGIAFALVVYGIFDGLLRLNLPAGPLETLIFGG